ncbi:TetR/AcrR family transcriptional regulator [Rhodococcus sp. D2-41]|uniref:TetR/AcrR family transcriptional regulator n=1 Tax=Speluncibacter jeojiensis TaxID=2710754 RepID=A0A9X4RHX6_9ACTN|nr:TetR/AcrR family transcriptional regulator [Rhodococcus sp. D2-41]MDG3009049.1 TetR/AcrR family transcriptional regulator [Rhodococcus sp. D2-41]MDG3015561.1 TetR/AcrR family transcriptional regulator [Corynebacteriales bacterium D3-21]
MPESVQVSPRKRPKNRRAQIAAVAAAAFSERGYHAVGVDDIAAAVGISGPALYRHFPNKYALFQHAARSLVDALVSATDDSTRTADSATGRLDELLTAIISTTLTNRTTGGLYRWEGRYLAAEDRATIRSQLEIVNRRIGSELSALRPELADRDVIMLSAATLSVIGSITAHRAPLPAKRIEDVLRGAAWSVLRCELPPAAACPPQDAPPPQAGLAMASKREALLHEAMTLFDRRGYHEVSIEEIAAAAGMNASGVYRHFAGKSDLLAAAFHRASDRLTVAVGSALAESQTPEQALPALVEIYVRLSFAQRELLSVYFAEIGNLPPDQRRELHKMQRLNIEEWVHLLTQLRPETPAAESRYLVHAAFALVLDIGRLVRFDASAPTRRRVQQLMMATLLGS